MKILMITDKMELGGAETHIYTLCAQLSNSGEDVTLLSAGGVYANRLAKEYNIKCITAPLDKRDYVSVLRASQLLRGLMRHFDLIHAHTRYTSTLACYIRGKLKRPAIVSTAHLPFPVSGLSKRTNWADVTLAVSRDIATYLEEKCGVPGKNIILTRNGIDVDIFNGRRKDQNFIIHTSRLDEDRCLTAFLLTESAPEILNGEGTSIIIVGDGNKRHELALLADKVNCKLGYKGVILLGKREDIPDILAVGKIFVGVSRAALEAMAMGLPTVLCGNEGYGGIVNSENIEELEKTNLCARGLGNATAKRLTQDIKKLLHDAELRKQLSCFGKAVIRKEWSAERLLNDAYRAYKLAMTPPRLCLIGYFGYSNLGDEQTLRVALNEFTARGISSIIVLDTVGGGKTDDSGIIHYNRKSPKEIKTAILKSDIIIFCGGNLFQNETSMRSLFYYSAAACFASKAKKKIYMLSSGFGKIHGSIGLKLTKDSLSRCDFIGARTDRDKAFANKLSAHAPIKLMPDFCFLLQAQNISSKTDHFAIIPSRADFISAEDVAAIEGRTGLTPKIIILSVKDDEEKASILFEKSGINIYTPHDFHEFSDIISNCAFVISGRLHGAIFSVISRKPAYLWDGSDKNIALIEELKKRAKENETAQILFPYSKGSLSIIKKEVGVCDSDFDKTIYSLRKDIYRELDKLFGNIIR